jgi:adenine phosphoribosyltransferase
MDSSFDLDAAIRKVPDFPKKGILFYDITSILAEPKAFRYCIDSMVELYAHEQVDAVAAIESRGFVFAAPFADRLGIPLILIRTKGKLPGETISRKYQLEYGEAELEVHGADVPRETRTGVGRLIARRTLRPLPTSSSRPRLRAASSRLGVALLNYRAVLGTIRSAHHRVSRE